MYVEHRGSGKSPKVTGAVAAVALTAGMGWFLVDGMDIGVERIEPVRSELVLLSPPPPPPPEPEPPVEPPEEIAATPPVPELVAPPVEFVPEEPPVIVAPPAPPEPVVLAPPAPPAAPAGTGRSPPKLLASDKPEYPSASRRNGEQGTTQLVVCVSASGRVTSARIARSSGHQRLDEAAVRWIRGERFQPARVNGVAQEVCDHKVYYEWNLRDA